MIEITEDTTLDELSKESRAELDELATELGLDAAEFKNRHQLAGAILSQYDDAEDENRDDDGEDMPVDPKLADVRHWLVRTQVQYMSTRGKRSLAAAGDTLKDIPSAMAQDLFRRGVLEPVLR
jgi:hypothetical protein